MDNHDQLNEIDDQKLDMLNGRSVMNVLAMGIRTGVTENELLKSFVGSTGAGEPHYDVQQIKQEIKRILDIGVSNGFIGKNGNKYSVPRIEDIHHVDCDQDSEEEDFHGFSSPEKGTCPPTKACPSAKPSGTCSSGATSGTKSVTRPGLTTTISWSNKSADKSVVNISVARSSTGRKRKADCESPEAPPDAKKKRC